VKQLVSYLERQGSSGASLSVIDRSMVAAVVAEQTRNEDDVKHESVGVISSFNLPRYVFDTTSSTYRFLGDSFSLHGDASSKLAIFEERLALVRARLLRRKEFQVPLPGVKRKYHKLTRVDDLGALEGSNEEIRTVMMLGVLTQAEEGVFCLEDGSGSSIALDLSNVKELCSGIFTESCIVLVQGLYSPDEEAKPINKEGEEEDEERVGKNPSSLPSFNKDIVSPLEISVTSETHNSSSDFRDVGTKTEIYMGVGGKGRSSTASQFPSGTGGGGGSSFTACYSCGLEGHRSSECPTKSARNKEHVNRSEDGGDVRKFGNMWKGGRSVRVRDAAIDDLHAGLSSTSSSSTSTTFHQTTESSFKPFSDERIRGLVKVHVLGFPPFETREATLRAMAVVDPLCVLHSPAELVNVKRLMQTSSEVQSTTFSIFSDLHLDKPEVLEGLRKVLASDSSSKNPSALYIFMGNFSSLPLNEVLSNPSAYRAGFEALASLLANFPDVTAKSRFVFIPGPSDPGSANVLPRPPLPSSFVKCLLSNEAIPHVTFASNPARIRFYSQEIVLFREDLSLKLRRRAILTPLYSLEGESRPISGTQHMSQTILRQGHLCPVPLNAQPIFWELDYTLRLSPLPEFIVIAEDEEQFSYPFFSSESDDKNDNPALATVILNPGSFGTQRDFSLLCPAKLETWARHGSLDDIVAPMNVKDEGREEGV
jgi:hypothetical protein